MTTLAVLALVLAGGAGASQFEDATGVKYQHDGGTEGDASDVCDAPSPVLPVPGNVTGLLVPFDDPVDHYNFNVTPGIVGDTFKITLQPSPLTEGLETPAPDYDLVVHEPGCHGVVASSDRNGSTQEDVLFTPQDPGNYTVTVEPGEMHAGDVVGPTGCHPVCVGTVNEILGYQVAVIQA